MVRRPFPSALPVFLSGAIGWLVCAAVTAGPVRAEEQGAGPPGLSLSGGRAAVLVYRSTATATATGKARVRASHAFAAQPAAAALRQTLIGLGLGAEEGAVDRALRAHAEELARSAEQRLRE